MDALATFEMMQYFSESFTVFSIAVRCSVIRASGTSAKIEVFVMRNPPAGSLPSSPVIRSCGYA